MTAGGGDILTTARHDPRTLAPPVRPTAPADGAWIDHPSGYLALSARNRRFELPGRPGFIAFRAQGRHLVAFGGVHAPASACDRLLDAFLAHAAGLRKVALFVQVREHAVPLFLARGMSVNQCGASLSLDLAGYSLAGAEKRRLRKMISRARRAGIRTGEIGIDMPDDAATFAQLHAISAAWLTKKGKSELDFMIGEIGAPGDQRRRIFVAVDESGRAVGFVTCVPAWGRMPGYLLDLTRALPDAPIGTMDAVIAAAMATLKREGTEFAHLGFAPFIVSGDEYPGASRAVAWLGRMLRRYGQALYPSESQLGYKLKWGPGIIDREFIAARPLSWRAVFDILRLTRSL
jgi:lysylphosphatidylglycerol synthetase-like protein (DUF2156 family)